MKLRNPKVGRSIKVEELVDDQILRRLDESGYIDKLFADSWGEVDVAGLSQTPGPPRQ